MRHLPLIAVVAGLLVLTGCSAATKPAHASTPKPAVASYSASVADQKSYVALLDVIPSLNGTPSSSLLKLGPKVCANTKLAESVRRGQPGVVDEISGMSTSGLTVAQNALVVVASIKVFCPQFTADIPPQYLSN